MTFCKRRVCRASAKDELQTIGRPPSQLGGAGRSADCSQLYALQFYTARCKHSALRAPCSQRFTPESGALRPTLMPEASCVFDSSPLIDTINRVRSNGCADNGTRISSFLVSPSQLGNAVRNSSATDSCKTGSNNIFQPPLLMRTEYSRIAKCALGFRR